MPGDDESTLVWQQGDEPGVVEPTLVSSPTHVPTDVESTRTSPASLPRTAPIPRQRRFSRVLIGQLAALRGCLTVVTLAYLAHRYVDHLDAGYVSLYRSAHGYPSQSPEATFSSTSDSSPPSSC